MKKVCKKVKNAAFCDKVRNIGGLNYGEQEKRVLQTGPMTEGKRNIIQRMLQEYNIESAADIQEALKDLLCGTIKAMMEAEFQGL